MYFRRERSDAALSRSQYFAYWAMLGVGTGLIVGFGSWWFSLYHVASNFSGSGHILDYLLFLILSYVVWHQIAMDVLMWSVAAKAKKLQLRRPEANLRVAFITTFVPGKEPLEMLEQALVSMKDADYPHDTWVLDEGNSPEVRALCDRLGVNHFSRRKFAMYNTDGGRFAMKTKGGNHNAWYHAFGRRYDIVAQMDTDFVAKRTFLTKTLGYFRDARVAFVGTPQVYGNIDQSIVARGAAQQTYGFYGAVLRGFSGYESTLLIGANHVVRVSALEDIGFYRAHVTEDLLTGMTLHSGKWTSVYVPETLAVGEGPSSWGSYFDQQMRWAFGCIDILFHRSAKLLKKMDRPQAVRYFMLQQHYFNGVAQVLGILLLTLYFLFGISATSMNLNVLIELYVPLTLWQLFMAVWLQRFNVNQTDESGMLWAGRFVSIAAWPIYFMAFIGALRGKRLVYKVTPKGAEGSATTPLAAFLPHLVLGSITALDLVLSLFTHNQSGVLIMWAILNTVLMYSVVASELAFRARGKSMWLVKRFGEALRTPLGA